jgi:adenylate cyclase
MAGDAIKPFSLSFESRDLEAEYWRRNRERLRRKTALTVVLVLLLFTGFGFLDPWIVPEIVPLIWQLRAAPILWCVVVIALTRTPVFDRRYHLIVSSLPLLGGLSILVMIALAGETGRLLYYAGLILAIIWTTLLSELRFPLALGISFYLIAGYEVISLFISPVALPVILNNTAFLLGTLLMSATGGYTIERAARVNFAQSLTIDEERRKSEAVLANTLPREIMPILKSGRTTVADRYAEASILFADMVGFTTLSRLLNADDIVRLLNEVFTRFDERVEARGLEKIRTIGDSYMVAAGVPRPCEDHAGALADLAAEMHACVAAIAVPTGARLALRIGISTGPVVAGVIGTRKLQYDVWGDAVNAASRMESLGVPGRTQITRATWERLADRYACEARGLIEVKGMGPMEAWLLGERMAGGPGGASAV